MDLCPTTLNNDLDVHFFVDEISFEFFPHAKIVREKLFLLLTTTMMNMNSLLFSGKGGLLDTPSCSQSFAYSLLF